MKRRNYLTASLVALAGCLSQSDSDNDSGNSDEIGEYDHLEVDFTQMYALEELEFFDHDIDDISSLEPDNDWWVQTAINIRNQGGDEIELPESNSFEIATNGSRYESSSEFPEIEFDDLRLDDEHSSFWMPPGYGTENDTIDGGDRQSLYLIHDIPEDENAQLIWESPEGDEFQLSPDLFLPPEGSS